MVFEKLFKKFLRNNSIHLVMYVVNLKETYIIMDSS